MKACLIIGPAYALHFEEPYNLVKEGVLKGGVWCLKWQLSKDKPNAIAAYWYTTLNPNRPEKKKLILTKTYNPQDYPRYDNYPAIEVGAYKNIPVDYQGDMGVATMILLRYSGDFDYEIVDGPVRPKLKGKTKFPRLIIRNKRSWEA